MAVSSTQPVGRIRDAGYPRSWIQAIEWNNVEQGCDRTTEARVNRRRPWERHRDDDDHRKSVRARTGSMARIRAEKASCWETRVGPVPGERGSFRFGLRLACSLRFAECLRAPLRRFTHVGTDLGTARALLPRLERLLGQVPAPEEAIVGAEALALRCELREDVDGALVYRRREVELMRLLYESIRESGYDAETRSFALRGRGKDVFEERLSIIRDLERRKQEAAGDSPEAR